MAPLILTLAIRWGEWSASRQELLAHTEQEAARTTEALWSFWKREKLLVSDNPTAVRLNQAD